MSDQESRPLDSNAAEEFDHLAQECWRNRRMSDAVSYYRQALAVRVTTLGADHHEVADSLVRLAGAIGMDDRECTEPAVLWRQAADIYEPLYRQHRAAKGELFQHIFMGLVGTLSNLAGQSFSQGQTTEAEVGYRHIQTMIDESYGTDCRWMPPFLPTYAKVLIQQGKQGEAETLLVRIVRRTPDTASWEGWIVTQCQKVLGELYVNQGRLEEAETVCRQAVKLLHEIDRPIPNLLASVLENLAGICRTTGRIAEADSLVVQARAARVPEQQTC